MLRIFLCIVGFATQPLQGSDIGFGRSSGICCCVICVNILTLYCVEIYVFSSFVVSPFSQSKVNSDFLIIYIS